MKYFLYSITSGLMFGLGGILMKILLANEIFLIIFNPLFLLAILLGILAFITNQVALKNGKSSNVTMIIAVVVTIVSIIGGIFLGEIINIYEIIGIVLMLISMSLLLSK